MTDTLLLEYFDDLLLTPENAEQLNNAVLQLAIRGKLSPQVKSDEPASELIKRIRNFKGGSAEFSPIKENEKPFELPDGWEWIRFGDVTINRDGERIPVSKEDRETRDGDFDYYGASGIIDKIDKYLFDKPLLLIGEDGANLINRSTPIAFIAHGKYWVNNHAHVLDAIDFGILKYLEVYINAIDLKPYITGTAQPKMNQAKMNSIVVALPPLAEQQRIVDRVEELFAQTRALAKELAHSQIELDGLNKSALSNLLASETPEEFNQHWEFIAEHFDLLSQSPEHITPLRQSILELAVRGKLTKRDVSDGKVLLATDTNSISGVSKKRAGRLWGSGLVPELTDIERNRLPTGWKWAKVKELGENPNETVQVGPMSMKSQDFEERGVPVLNVGCVQWGWINEAKLDFMPEDKAANFERYRIKSGDVLFTRSGTIGRCAIAQDKHDGWLMTFHLLRVRPSRNKCISKYLQIVFEGASHIRRQAQEASIGSTRAGFNTNLLAMLDVPLPPLAEQERIVKRVEQLLSLCDALEGRLRSAEEERGRLVRAVMAGVGS